MKLTFQCIDLPPPSSVQLSVVQLSPCKGNISLIKEAQVLVHREIPKKLLRNPKNFTKESKNFHQKVQKIAPRKKEVVILNQRAILVLVTENNLMLKVPRICSFRGCHRWLLNERGLHTITSEDDLISSHSPD